MTKGIEVREGNGKRKGGDSDNTLRKSARLIERAAEESDAEHQIRKQNAPRSDLSRDQLKCLEKCIKETPVEQDISWNDIGRKVLKVLKPEDQDRVKDLVTGRTRSSQKRYSEEAMISTAKRNCNDVYNNWTNQKKKWKESQQSGGNVPPRQRSRSRTRREDRPKEKEGNMAPKERNPSSPRGDRSTTPLPIRPKHRSQAPPPPSQDPAYLHLNIYAMDLNDPTCSTIVRQPVSAVRSSIRREQAWKESRESGGVQGNSSH
jgi:hypothetical protein